MWIGEPFMSLNHVCFVWLKLSPFHAFWKALDYEIAYETWGHETWNCQQKNHIASTKFKLKLAMVSKTCLGSLDHTSLSLSKNEGKKVAYNLSSNLEKLCNNLFMQEKWKRLRSCNLSTTSKKLYSNALCAYQNAS